MICAIDALQARLHRVVLCRVREQAALLPACAGLWELSNKEMAPRLRKLVKKQMGGTVTSHVVGTALGITARASNLLTGKGLSAVPKFDRPESIHVIVAGGSAGKFSAFMPCFGFSR